MATLPKESSTFILSDLGSWMIINLSQNDPMTISRDGKI